MHRGAFGSSWTDAQHAESMSFPGYHHEHELLCVAPDGTLTGFAIVWLDARNRIGLFEPVGTHEDHRRRGVGRALLAAGLRLMRSAGMKAGTVASEAKNVASNALYSAAGFRPWLHVETWEKSL